jgi:hypothetical protein
MAERHRCVVSRRFGLNAGNGAHALIDSGCIVVVDLLCYIHHLRDQSIGFDLLPRWRYHASAVYSGWGSTAVERECHRFNESFNPSA